MFRSLSAHLLVIMLRCLGTSGQDVPSAPTILTVSSPTPTSIVLTWDQPEGSADDVEGYQISYDYSVDDCSSEGGTFPTVTVILNNGSLRSYTISNSLTTPVEEDSHYAITLTAVSNGTSSALSNEVMVTTEDGAPGAPQSLRIGSVDVTNITIQWNRVNCLQRNGHIDSYRVIYYLTSNPSRPTARTVFGTDDRDRMFSVTGLPPRTSYTFEVEAQNPGLRGVTPAIANISGSTTAPRSVGFLLSGQLYVNNSLVTLTDIGNRFSSFPLYCLTPRLDCCSSSSLSGEWYLPDGTAVSSSTTPFSRTQVLSAVSLFRNSAATPTGVFHCKIPDASGNNQNIYVGIYPQGVGSPSITSVVFDRNSTTLTCTSTGGPPTTVTWKKNNVPVNTSTYEQSQRLVDTELATYENTLFSRDIADFVGTFTCEVSNARARVQETTELNGVSIIRDQLRIGNSATARCSSDAPATRMEWLNNGVVVASDVSTQQLDLMFSPVNDSIHNQVYVCRVTREGGRRVEQNFTARVQVSPEVVNITVGRMGLARAGISYTLICTVSKTVEGLVNSPTAAWTTTGGVAVTNGSGITVFAMRRDTATIATLTFDPLKASHNGRYSCDSTLTSPALETVLMLSSMETLYVDISTPDVVVTAPSSPLFAGSTTPLILTCTITINPATDTDVLVDVTWLNGTTSLSSSDSRVTISPVTGSRLSSFISTLTLDPLSIFDNTTFTCRARARPPPNQQSFIQASAVGEVMGSILINIPSSPRVSIAHSSSSVMAGQPLRLTCSSSVQDGIRGSAVLTWMRDGQELSANNISGSLVLSFSSMLIRDAGQYTCTAELTIPDAGVDVSGEETASIFVQVPPPNVTVASRQDGQCSKVTILNCTTDEAYGFLTPPTLTWLAPDGSLVSTEESANPRVDVQNRQLKFSDVSTAKSGVYMCQIDVARDNRARSNIAIDSNVPDVLQGLKCEGSSSTELTLVWDSLSLQEGDKVSFVGDINELRHRDGTRDVIQYNVTDFMTDSRSITIQQLAAEVPYNITVKAVNLAGCGEESQVYCFTQEGDPPVPENVAVIESNTTSIKISWKRFTLVELKGLANYTVSYVAASRKRQALTTIVSVPWTENSVIIRNLTSGVEYDITVSVSLRRRTSTPQRIIAVTSSIPGTPDNNLLPIIIGIVVPVAVVLALICVVLVGVCVIRKKRHSDEVKLEKSRMLRAFEEPMIMLESKDRQSTSIDKEAKEEAIASSELKAEKPSATPAGGDCELVESPAHVPSTFTASKESAEAI